MTVRPVVRSVIKDFLNILSDNMEWINAKTYGAKGDARQLSQVVTVVNATTLSAPVGVFTSADVGKIAWGTSSAGGEVIPLGTVTAYSNNQIILSTSNGVGVGQVIAYFYIGTNDTAALQTAWAAALAQNKSLYYPEGWYCVNRQIVGGANQHNHRGALIGSGSASTRFILMPDFSTVGADLSAGSPPGVLINTLFTCRNYIGGFSVDAAYLTRSMSGYSVVCIGVTAMAGESYGLRGTQNISDIYIANERGFTASITLFGLHNVNVSNIFAYNSSYYGIFFHSCMNTQVNNLFTSNGAGRAVGLHQSDLCMVSPMIDEHLWRGLEVDNSRLRIYGPSIIYAGPISTTQPVVDILGNTSVVDMDSVEIRPYGSNPVHYDKQSCVSVASGSIFRMRNCKITSGGAVGSKAITGAGLAVDLGENIVTGTVDISTKRTVQTLAGW